MALLAALVFLVSRERGVVAPPRAPAAAAKEPVELQPPVALAPPALEPVAERAAVAPAPPAAPASLAPKTCEIRGRFVLPGGAPAVGARYEIHGWESNDDDVARYGRPERWDDLDGQTDADGHLSVRFEPPRAYQFTLEVKLTGYAGAQWRWRELLAGKVVDVGEVELVSGGAIEGRIVDAEGHVVPEDWMVYAESIGLRGRDGRDETQVMELARPDGSFRVEGVRPGRVELTAYGDDWTEATIVQVRSGETATADIVTKRREAASRITLLATWKHSGALGPDPEHVSLTGPDATARKAGATRMRMFAFENLASGEYRLAIDDPRFQPWTRTAQPGEIIEIELEGTSALDLRVRGPDGKANEFYAVDVELRNVNFSPHTFEVSAASLQLQHGRLGGLVPGDYRLTVRAGGALGSLDVDGLALGETRPVEVHLRTPPTIRGVVRYSDGVPAAGAEVTLLEAGGTQLSMSAMTRNGHVLSLDGHEPAATDERGEFRLSVARDGEYVVRASDDGGMAVSSEPIQLAGADRGGLELVLPRGGFLAGRLLAPHGAAVLGLRAWAFGVEELFGSGSVEVDAGGRFELGPLLPGTKKIYLELPQPMRRLGAGFGSGRGPSVELGELEIEDGKRVARDFTVDWPGAVVLSVLVNGEAIAGVSVELEGERQVVIGGVNGETDTRGEVGPLLAFAGAWRVRVRDVDAGWRYDHPTPVVVASGSESRARIAVQVSEATLQFLDAESGKPLAKRMISALGPPGDRLAEFAWQRRRTDAEGRASWNLASGEYRFRLDPEGEEFPFPPAETEPAVPARMAPLRWTLTGPLTRELRL